MTKQLFDAIHDRLTSDQDLTNCLEEFEDFAAIFIGTPVPAGVVGPFIAIPAIITQTPNDAKGSVGRVVTIDIGCFARNDGDPTRVEEIAERVWALFHRWPMTTADWEVVISKANGPIVAPTDKTMYGRIVTLTLNIWKK